MKRKYELMAIIRPSITDKEIDSCKESIKELLGKEIVYEEIWGMRPFAYRIKKESKGYYVVWNFLKESEEIRDVEKNLLLMPNVLRFLMMSIPEDYKPITLPEIQAGLEKLQKEKEAKRVSKAGFEPSRASSQIKKIQKEPVGAYPGEKKEEISQPKEAVTKEIEVQEKPVAPEKTVKTMTPETKKEKTFDQKLEDILHDEDLGL